ncbi:polyketide cyclase [Mycobacterium asiaticum]|uniref:Polyketide cyclase n=1 Tax=Mycobacterium asiaticum TaxID=1790 RepID=A0A1A3NHY6_MYCAS|nr:nuclear transport factor 2 family protein [Mycobacterium asiaticum]OBK21411.1 polyketide cyclase [Mycobacterium asiaticum]
MGKFAKAEIEDAVRHYTAVAAGCSESGDWRPFADLFTEDVVYIEHHYGVFHGREAVREWIVDVMAPFPHMRFPSEWIAYDEDNDAVVIMIKNLLDHPTDPNGEPFWFPNWTRLVYAGDGLFSSEEDIYNPKRDAPRVVGEWMRAGGKLATDAIPGPKPTS